MRKRLCLPLGLLALSSVAMSHTLLSQIDTIAPHSLAHPTQTLPTLVAQKQHIRHVYNDVNRNLNTYKRNEFEKNEQTSLGGRVVIYTGNNQIKKVEEVYFGETGKRSFDYYFDENQLRFIFEQLFTYNAPVYLNTPDPNFGKVTFDDSKTTIAENRYYFYNGNMIEWLDGRKKKVPRNALKFKHKQKELLDQALFD